MWLTGLQLMTPYRHLSLPNWNALFGAYTLEHEWPQTPVFLSFGLHYWDVSLAGLRGRDRNGRRRRFHLRYDPDDVSRVAVFEHGNWLGDGYAKELRLPETAMSQSACGS